MSDASGALQQSDRWEEPSARVPVRFGSYGLRLRVGIAALVTAAGVYFFYFLQFYWNRGFIDWNDQVRWSVWAVALLVAVGAYAVLPGAGWRRLAAGAVTALGALPLMFMGVGSTAAAISYALAPAAFAAGWLLVRERPARSYWALFGTAVLLLLEPVRLPVLSDFFWAMPWLEQNVVRLVALLAVTVAICWFARWIAMHGPSPAQQAERRRLALAEREAALHAVRVQQLREWEAAYVSVHGAPPPPGAAPALGAGVQAVPRASRPSRPFARAALALGLVALGVFVLATTLYLVGVSTLNLGVIVTGSVLSLVSGIPALLAVILGHVAVHRARPLGVQAGAVVGMVIGYLLVALLLVSLLLALVS